KAVQTRTEELQARRNALSKQIGMAKGKGEDATAQMAEVAASPMNSRPAPSGWTRSSTSSTTC
ncbi:hypothetical protein Q6294_32830, partial [Klebsiella pneumoniae]|nr:hypothetical protein [Klebsiella pneumoniae]